MKYSLITLVLIITGCEVSAPLTDLRYDGAVTSESIAPVLVTLTTGEVEGSGHYFVVPGTVAPIKSEPEEELQFNLRDQIAFREYLAAELSRAGIFNAFTDPDSIPLPLYVIDVTFQRTNYSSASSSYQLDAQMSIRNGDDILIMEEYHLNESMTLSNFLWHGDPAITKNTIAKMLLTQIIQDIDSWATDSADTL